MTARLYRVGLGTVCAALLATGVAQAHAHRVGGIVPDLSTPSAPAAQPARAAVSRRARAAARPGGLRYNGGPVLHWNRTHLIFWEPERSGLQLDPGYEALIERFLEQVAADSHLPTNVYGLTGQYTDRTGPAAYASSYGGAVIDREPLPASQCAEPVTGPAGWSVCLTDDQLQAELQRVVSADRLPQGGNDIYFMVLPDGFGSCIDASSTVCALGGSASGYCGYHSETQGGLLYAVIPYNAVPGHCQSTNPRPNGSTADPALSTISHEQMETITDPDTWNSWIDPSGNEMGDLCITDFGSAIGGSGSGAYNQVIDGGHYWLQEEWSNEDGGCRPRPDPDAAFFGAPSRAVTGEALRLSARASAAHGRIIAFAWFFGDGGASHRRVTTHVYGRSASFRIVLRVTDSAGNWTFFTRNVRVLPSPPLRRHGDRSRSGATQRITRR